MNTDEGQTEWHNKPENQKIFDEMLEKAHKNDNIKIVIGSANSDHQLLLWLKQKKLLSNALENIELKDLYALYLKDDNFHNKPNENG